MNRRASLPGIDELFRSSGDARGEEQPPPEDVRSRAGTGPEDPAVTEALVVLQQVAANEGSTLRAAREAARDLRVPSPAVGTLLRWAVAACEARAVVEIGAAAGISALWMLEAMPDGGVLTSLEPDPEGQRLASKAVEGVVAGSRIRSIHGDAATLLERLADGGYDLVLLQTDHARYPGHLERARALLRPGGMLVARGVLPVGQDREPLTRFLHGLVDDPAFNETVLPIEDGVAIANRLPHAEHA